MKSTARKRPQNHIEPCECPECLVYERDVARDALRELIDYVELAWSRIPERYVGKIPNLPESVALLVSELDFFVQESAR